MVAPTIGEQGRERIRRMAARRWGVILPEIVETLDVSYWAARRFVKRLLDEGVLSRTGERRRRTEIFAKVHGAGGFVYRARRISTEGKIEWEHSKTWRARSRSKAKYNSRAR